MSAIKQAKVDFDSTNKLFYLEVWLESGEHKTFLVNDVLYMIARPQAAELAALQAENARLRSALEKIAKMDGPSFAEAFGRCVDIARDALSGDAS